MTDAAAPGSPDHFIQQLPFRYEPANGDGLLLSADVRHPDDVGLLATMIDVAGGILILSRRSQVAVPTTSIELLGLDQLVRPGPLQMSAQMVSLGRRRASIEADLDVSGCHAWARVDFFVVERNDRPTLAVHTVRAAPSAAAIELRMSEHVGVRPNRDGVEVDVTSRLFNSAGALQGGATVSLLEAAARSVMTPGESIAAASISYLRQVIGDVGIGRVRWRRGNLITADVKVAGDERVCATGTFQLR